ncbi:unnamed protein product [Plutella xylostella]|uniref:ubiquitinyl hydrolase 1 n=1 Tax=Plutella xylostella TaxID=51655 RepID=A0A8S4DI67_PLUXY|nr:unnamed protein product [Plutella xylostella]
MSDQIQPQTDDTSRSSKTNTQVDLFHLIGGSWPPAPREPECPEYGSVPRARSRTMNHPSQSDRVKSVNIINHIAPDKRRKAASSNSSTLQRSKPKMVHEPKKVETGLLVDVHGSEAPDAVYDQPAPGSPRPAPRRSPSPPLLPDDIGVGSLVEVATDVDQHYYGVVRWIGLVDDTATAGIELEESIPGLSDGCVGGTRVFSCAAGRALFVPPALCRRDARFRDTPEPQCAVTDSDDPDQPDCPVVPGVVPPLSALGDLAGRSRGIQGHHNSCYLDATLFAMFTFTSVFDSLLYRPPEPEVKRFKTYFQKAK